MASCQTLLEQLQAKFEHKLQNAVIDYDELILELSPETAKEHLLNIAKTLRDDDSFHFELLIDLCAVDYLTFGVSEWETNKATETGFSRGRVPELTEAPFPWKKPRFAVVYHLLSLKHHHRLRLKVFVHETELLIPSVVSIWNCANWYEREAFDLYGILFTGHPDLRRILTDYGFIGHPFRKDFPLIGQVEMRYSKEEQRVVYEPVSIQPRTLVPKTIRADNRYLKTLTEDSDTK